MNCIRVARRARPVDRFETTPTRPVRDAVSGALGPRGNRPPAPVAEAGAQNQALVPTRPTPRVTCSTQRPAPAPAAGSRATLIWRGVLAKSMQRQSGADPDPRGVHVWYRGDDQPAELLGASLDRGLRRLGPRSCINHDEVRNPAGSGVKIFICGRAAATRARLLHAPCRPRAARPRARHAPGTHPMIRSFDPATGALVNVGGNEAAGPGQRVGHSQRRREPARGRAPARAPVDGPDAARGGRARRRPRADRCRATSSRAAPLIEAWDARKKPSRVFGWGRLSLGDDETNPYRLTAPPPPPRAL